MQGGKNWILPKQINANRFFWDSHWLEIWSNYLCHSMRPNRRNVAMDSEPRSQSPLSSSVSMMCTTGERAPAEVRMYNVQTYLGNTPETFSVLARFGPVSPGRNY
jgi:hypothetical protein